MLLRHLVYNRYITELQDHPHLAALLEDAGALLHAAARAAKSDREELEKFDMNELADVITAIKLLTNPNYRSVMTRRDIGVDPRNAEELLQMLGSIPSLPSKDMPSKTKEFVKALALMGKSLRAKELEELKKLLGASSSERDKAISDLQALSNNVVKALDSLKAKAEA